MRNVQHFAFICLIAMTGCNAPAMWGKNAEEYLQKKGVRAEVIEKLVERQALTAAEVDMLMKFENESVKHLVGRNPGTPEQILRQLADDCREARWGVASNPKTPMDLLLSMRAQEKNSSLSIYLAQNPNTPSEILLEMCDNREIPLGAIAARPHCPLSVMREIADGENASDRWDLAKNPELPRNLFEALKEDPESQVRACLGTNPRIPKDILEDLLDDEDETVRNAAQRNHVYKRHYEEQQEKAREWSHAVE